LESLDEIDILREQLFDSNRYLPTVFAKGHGCGFGSADWHAVGGAAKFCNPLRALPFGCSGMRAVARDDSSGDKLSLEKLVLTSKQI
jgi:hypothetical protein